MWGIIQPKGRGTNQTPPLQMSSITLRRKETIPISPWVQRVSRGLWQKEQDVPAQTWTATLWRSGTADGLKSWLHNEGSKYSDWGHQEDRCSAVVGCLPEKHSHWWFRETFMEFVWAKKRVFFRETTDRKWNIPGILLTSLNQLKVRNVSEHISDRSLADMDSSFSPGSRSGRNRGQSEKEQMSHVPLVQGQEHGSCPHSYLLPP